MPWQRENRTRVWLALMRTAEQMGHPWRKNEEILCVRNFVWRSQRRNAVRVGMSLTTREAAAAILGSERSQPRSSETSHVKYPSWVSWLRDKRERKTGERWSEWGWGEMTGKGQLFAINCLSSWKRVTRPPFSRDHHLVPSSVSLLRAHRSPFLSFLSPPAHHSTFRSFLKKITKKT